VWQLDFAVRCSDVAIRCLVYSEPCGRSPAGCSQASERWSLQQYPRQSPGTGIAANSRSSSMPTAGMLRDVLFCCILWKENPFSCSKTFGKCSCKLCQNEWVVLLWHSWTDGSNKINDHSEIIHGSCCH
jgi:hypothetical protein